MSVCSHPSEGHLMSEEVRGSEGISPRLIEKNFNGSVAGMTFLWTHIWMLLFVALGTPPPYPGQWQNTGLHLLPKWLGHGHRQARIRQLARRYVLKGSVSCSSLLIYFTLWTSKSDWFNHTVCQFLQIFNRRGIKTWYNLCLKIRKYSHSLIQTNWEALEVQSRQVSL